MSNKPFPQTPVLTDDELALIKLEHIVEGGIIRPDIRDYVYAVRDAQARASERNRDKQIFLWLDTECECFGPPEKRWFCPHCRQALKGD